MATAPDTLLVTVNSQEIATLLAALRYFQMVAASNGVPMRVREHFVEHGPLSRDEIDTLCERINTPCDPHYINLDFSTGLVASPQLHTSRQEAEDDRYAQLDDVIAVPILYNLQQDDRDQEESDDTATDHDTGASP